jgi:hypothetical protein
VDFLEMKSYGDIDIDETPIVVLGCGHFFTAESLDGLMSMSDVYEMDNYGEFIGLKEVSDSLAQAIPSCPDCKCPVRQFATKRYNRVINRAVIDEMSKRFLTSGRDELRALESKIVELEHDLEESREEIVNTIVQARAHLTLMLTRAKRSDLSEVLTKRYEQSKKLENDIKAFCSKAADKHQPAQKLHEATVYAKRKEATVTAALEVSLADLAVADIVPSLARDRRVTMGGLMVQLKTEYVILNDKFIVAQAFRSLSGQTPLKIPGGGPNLIAIPFFQRCNDFINECSIENLPKLSVEATLFYASIARSFESTCRSTNANLDKAAAQAEMAKQLLENAQEFCKQPFQNVEKLRIAVDDSIRLMRKQWYEEVTTEELKAIKAAMVSGSQGISTHSGHWYNCENGHPVSW